MESSKTPKKVTPLLRWAGSKQKLLSRLKIYWKPQYSRYIEPFAGSASLFYNVQPKDAVLGDINGDLIGCLRTVRNRPKDVYKALTSIPLGKRSYYRVRRENPKDLDAVNRAARFLFLNRFCFNGLYRTNKSGKFNVPFAATKTGDIPGQEDFLNRARRLKNVTFECRDFEAVVRKHAKKDAFVYFDPPYAVEARRIFKEYDSTEFREKDLDRLARLLKYLDKKKVAWVLSYAYSAEALRKFKQWPQAKVFAQRNIAGFARHRRKAAELIVTSRLTLATEFS